MLWIINNKTLPPEELWYDKWNEEKNNDGKTCSTLWVDYLNGIPPEILIPEG